MEQYIEQKEQLHSLQMNGSEGSALHNHVVLV